MLIREFGPLMMNRVRNGTMPPAQAAAYTPLLSGDPRLTSNELTALENWAAAGYPAWAGDIVAPPSEEPGDIQLSVSVNIPAATASVQDEIRCYYIPISGWVQSFRWLSVRDRSMDPPIHHIGASVVGTKGAAQAQALDGKDGRPGWPCMGDVGIETTGSLGTGSLAGGRVDYPPDAGVYVEQGIVLGVHRVLAGNSYVARDGVNLWMHAAPPPRRIVDIAWWAPAELPCDGCSREDALNASPQGYAIARANNDDSLKTCGYSLASYLHGQVGPLVHTACSVRSAVTGQIVAVHPHAHTMAVSAEVLLNDKPLAGYIPYHWEWEASAVLAQPITVSAGDLLTVRCAFDNGPTNQWSIGGGPGLHGPAAPPLQPQRWRIGGPLRWDEMCTAIVQVAQEIVQ